MKKEERKGLEEDSVLLLLPLFLSLSTLIFIHIPNFILTLILLFFSTISSNTIISTIHTTYNNIINRFDFRLSNSLSTDSFLDAEQTIDFISVLGSVSFIQFTNLGTDVASVIFIIPIVV